MKTMLWFAALLIVIGSSHATDVITANRTDVFASLCRVAVSATERGQYPPENRSEALRAAECFAYIKGYLDGHDTATLNSGAAGQYCLPTNVNYIQIARVVVKAADERPELGHLPRFTVVHHAIKSAWPCAKDKGGA